MSRPCSFFLNPGESENRKLYVRTIAGNSRHQRKRSDYTIYLITVQDLKRNMYGYWENSNDYGIELVYGLQNHPAYLHSKFPFKEEVVAQTVDSFSIGNDFYLAIDQFNQAVRQIRVQGDKRRRAVLGLFKACFLKWIDAETPELSVAAL